MAKDCPECGTISPDEARICDCGYSYASGTLRRETGALRRETDQGNRNIQRGQTYTFGWLVAISCLTGAANPGLFEAYGIALGAVHAVAFLIVGFAAAAVTAWSWFILLASQALFLVYGGYYMAFIARAPADRALVAVATVTMSVLQFVYFYKRRAMFGARWRCERLER